MKTPLTTCTNKKSVLTAAVLSFQVTHNVFILTCSLSSGLVYMTCSINSPASVFSSHLKVNRAKTELLSSHPLKKSPSKNQLCLSHFSKWHLQGTQGLNSTLKCHSIAAIPSSSVAQPSASSGPSASLHPPSIPLSSWWSSLAWKTH